MLNVKALEVKKDKEVRIEYDTEIDEELKLEGKVREVIRKVQLERKKLGLQPEDKIELVLPEKFKPWKEEIVKKILAKSVEFGTEGEISVKRA